MTEDEARAQIAAQFGERGADRVGDFLEAVIAENDAQNLIAPSTVKHIWFRHALDSAQLVRLGQPGLWIDVGTGGGFPGMIVAILRPDPTLLVEPRRRRAEFLDRCLQRLDVKCAEVVATKVERVTNIAATLSARAVASVEKLLQMAADCANEQTRWLLPRGRFGKTDLKLLTDNWYGMFHVEHSVTDPQSLILVLDGVGRR